MEPYCRDLLAVGPSLFQADAWKDPDTVIQLNIDGPKGGRFAIEIRDRRMEVREGTAQNADATVETRDEVLVQILLNLVDPMSAYMKRQVRVRGKVKAVLNVLSPKVLPRHFGLPRFV